MASSSPTVAASTLPVTPDNQTFGRGNEGGKGSPASPAMPPPPPFNTPSGAMDTGDVSAALGSTADANGVTGTALADMLSGIRISENASGDAGKPAGGRSGEGRDDDDDDEDYEEGEDNEVELPPEVMKRLYELKALQSEKDVVYERYKAKRAELEVEFAREYGAIYSRRAEVVAGRAKDMDDPDEADPTAQGEVEAAGGEVGIPHFWMQCMLHHEALHDVICEPDLEALYYLSDVRCLDKENLLGFTLEFHFDDNPYFTNAVLTKRYHTANIMDQGEPLLEGVEGTPIDWKSGRNLCEKTIRRKVKRAGSRSGESRTITKVEKTDSFFKFFQNPVMYEEDDDEEDDEEYNFSFDMDYEVARIFRNHLIPNAVLWFTGEAVSDGEDGAETDEEEGLDETGGASDDDGDRGEVPSGDDEGPGDGEGDGGAPTKKLNFKAPAGFEAPTSGSGPADGKECKQS